MAMFYTLCYVALIIMESKYYSISFNYYFDLIKNLEKLKLAMEEQKKGKIELLKKENIPFELDKETGMPIVIFDYLKDKKHILKYEHPLLVEIFKEMGIVKTIKITLTLEQRIEWFKNNKFLSYDDSELNWQEYVEKEIISDFNSYKFNNPIYGGETNMSNEEAKHAVLDDINVPRFVNAT